MKTNHAIHCVGPAHCGCACHENKLGKEYIHDEKCCELMHGYVKNCDCETKYCKHYESDFDRFVKTNPSQSWEAELLKIHYEPEHTAGGACWCGPTFHKTTDNRLEIKHNEQREILKKFVQSVHDEAYRQGYLDGVKVKRLNSVQIKRHD